MTPSESLRAARLAAGLTYREVGEAAHLDGSTIAHFEAGRYRTSPVALRRWRQALADLLAQRGRQIATVLNRL